MIKRAIYCFLLFCLSACEKKAEVEPIDLNKIEISKVKNFEIELPYGNEFYADGADAVFMLIHCYDIEGKVLNLSKRNTANYKLYADDIFLERNYYDDIYLKTNVEKEYKFTVEINGIKKSLTLNALALNKIKKQVIPLAFTVINEDFADEIFTNTIAHLNSVFNEKNNIDIYFKLKEYDDFGYKLKRPGVVDLKINDFKLDSTISASKYKHLSNCIDIFVLEKTFNWSGFFYENDIQVNTKIFSAKKTTAFTVLSHELGHLLGLKHIYRDDNECVVQEGVYDIEAYNNNNLINDKGKISYTTNCGTITKYVDNLMNGGIPNLTNDQKKIIVNKLKKINKIY